MALTVRKTGSGLPRPDPRSSSCLRDRRHRSGRTTLAQLARSGDSDVGRQATWGMSVAQCSGSLSNSEPPENQRGKLAQLIEARGAKTASELAKLLN